MAPCLSGLQQSHTAGEMRSSPGSDEDCRALTWEERAVKFSCRCLAYQDG